MPTFLGYNISDPVTHLIVTNSIPARSQAGQQVKGGGSDKRYAWRFTVGPLPGDDGEELIATVMSHFNHYEFWTPFDWTPPQPPGVTKPPVTVMVMGDAGDFGTVPTTVDRGAYLQIGTHRPVYQVSYNHRLEPRLINDGSSVGSALNAKVVYSSESPPTPFTTRTRGKRSHGSITVTLVEQR